MSEREHVRDARTPKTEQCLNVMRGKWRILNIIYVIVWGQTREGREKPKIWAVNTSRGAPLGVV